MTTGLEGKYVIKNNKKLAFGYTTGTCAAAAAKAATLMLFSRQQPEYVDIMTPKGIPLHLKVEDTRLEEDFALCAVQKDAGDDPDVTHGAYIYAKVKLGETGSLADVKLDGGIGVGRVTKPGLEQAVGEAAINKVPRQMIKQEVLQICKEWNYKGDILVEISVPQGEELAKRTFNPRLGIMGGISILGTSGIVEPMSEQALISSIQLEMRMQRNNGWEYLLISPGNYGAAFLEENFKVNRDKILKCSNYVGETLDTAVELGYKGLVLAGNIGKFIKVAGGIMNTHSRNSDSRMEILAANALKAGADVCVVSEILEALTAEEGIGILKKYNLLEATMKLVMEKIYFYMNNRTYGNLELGIIVFSNEYGELGRIGKIDGLIVKTQCFMEG
ncbi:MAG: cobalt-precorrin-5B (C(1))-methyltransferase CbiD [Firmicutes bacterium]|nr:cobalt-precorrin-5B (C(1))-methyltransferase CbiD [Bacillota bacterium]